MKRVTLDLNRARSFLDPDSLAPARRRATDAWQSLLEKRGPGSEWLGWLDLLAEPDLEGLKQLDAQAGEIRQDADLLVVCGIGGSYMGSRAVRDALRGISAQHGVDLRFAGHHMGSRAHQQLLDELETPRPDGRPKSIWVNVISKSGTTLETALAFRWLRTWMEKRYGEQESSRRIIVTTDPDSGALRSLARQKGYRTWPIAGDVGGRFSVLTAVGLLPIAVAGGNIHSLVTSASTAYHSLLRDPEPLLELATVRYLLHEAGYRVDLISAFDPDLEGLTGWLQQLLGESEGKQGKGLFPARALYSTDLHSIGQYVQEGQRVLMETVLDVVEETESLIPVAGEDEDSLGYLKGMSLHEINRQALEGTLTAHYQGGVPVVRVLLQRLDESTLGEFLALFELLTAVYGYMLGVNPFDQPGVEAYKTEMYRRLGRL
ncbi:MAG: glucose-6-phosphate isomerase [Bacteroidota bacterium]